MNHNPFYDVVKADAHTPQDVTSLFVREASPIWTDLQPPVNHIVVGARGTGKTMALRQLDYRTMASREEPPNFIGVYTHVSRISAIFHALFADGEGSGDKSLIHQFQQVFADYLALEVVRELCALSEGDDSLVLPEFDAVFRLPGGFNSEDMAENCARLQIQVESSIQSWQISRRCAWQPLGDLPTTIARLAQALRRTNSWLEQDRACLYLLLDESSPVPVACQSVLNSLLLRGQSYCVKIAVRPLEWSTLNTPSDCPKEQDTDVFVLHLNHSDELGAAYISHMEQIVERVLVRQEVSVPPIRKILPASPDFPYSGFDAICAVSSGNPQDLLLICSAIFSAVGNSDMSDTIAFEPVAPAAQDSVIRTWSRDFGNRNAYDGSRHLCRSLARVVRDAPESCRSIGFEYRSDEVDLFTDGTIPDDLAKPLRPAFAGGFVRLEEEAPVSLFNVPRRFRLSRGALPDLDVPLDTPVVPPVMLDSDFIETKSSTNPRRAKPRARPAPVVYMSSSFIETTDPRCATLTHSLRAAGFVFPKVRQTSKPSHWSLVARRKINKAHIALIGEQGPIFRTMFEMGMCAGATRPVDLIVGRFDDGETSIESAVGFPALSTVSHRSDDSDFSQFAAEARAVAEQLMASQSEFANVALTGVSLRPKHKREKTVYLSLPGSVAMDTLLAELRDRLAAVGWSLITEQDMKSYTANILQVPVLCVYTTRVGIIDTSSSPDGMDVLQSYKLGLFAGKKSWRVLHTSRTGTSISSQFDSFIGSECYRWEHEDDLVQRILQFVGN